MVRAAGSRGHLVYVGRSRSTMPFSNELPVGAEVLPDDEFGTPDVAALMERAQPGAAIYVCGPPAVIEAAQRSAFVVNPTGSLHTERFSAAPVVDGREFSVTLARSGAVVSVGADETALSAIRRERPGVVYSCQQGFCGTCKVRVLHGEVDHRERTLSDAERAGHMLTCVSRAAGDSLVIDL
jgi:ferredoxin